MIHRHPRILAPVLLALCLACSGGKASAPEPETPVATTRPESDKDRKRREALARLKARQEAACEKVGSVITDCAVADARATLSPEKLAELDLERTAPRHRAKFIESCTASDMSPRQVKVFESCLADTTCHVFLDCLDQAKPRK